MPLPQAPEVLGKDGLLHGPAVLIWFVDVGWIVEVDHVADRPAFPCTTFGIGK